MKKGVFILAVLAAIIVITLSGCANRETCEHDFENWNTITHPTKTEDGLKELRCSRCRFKKTEVIHATGSKGLLYSFDKETNTAKVIEGGFCNDEEIVIPKYVNEYMVTGIGEQAFSNDRDYYPNARSVKIPDTVVTIDAYAFLYSNVTEIFIPKSVEKIGEGAFAGCYDLAVIKVDEENKLYYAKDNCLIETETKTLIALGISDKIPKDGSVTAIGDGAFAYRSDLKSMSIPISIVSIGNNAFCWCEYLVTALPKELSVVGDGAFEGCRGIGTDISLPSTLTEIGARAFAFSQIGKELVIPKGVTRIGNEAFYGCQNIQKITIEGNADIIGDSAFENCTKLTAVSISGKVSEIGQKAFYGCKLLTRASLPGSLRKIGAMAFENCIMLATVSIPAGVTEIGDRAFVRCPIASVSVPRGVTSMGEGVFSNCEKLKTVSFLSEIKEIPAETFAYCTSITTFMFPKSISSIGDRAFAGCEGLKKIVFEGTKQEWQNIAFGVRWDEDVYSVEISCSDGVY